MSRLVACLVVVLGAASARATIITVTGTGDTIASDGLVTLREAITAANTNAVSGDAPAGSAGADEIRFNIPGGGVQTILLGGALPDITEPITISGYTQPGSSANTAAVGSNAVIHLELDASNTGGAALTLKGGASTVRGLCVHGAGGAGVALLSDNNVVAGNFLGTNPAGASALANNSGVLVSASKGNTVGGTAAVDRNLVSGNATGITVDGVSTGTNTIVGNLVGTTASGLAALGNSAHGVSVSNSAGTTTIGGTTASARNVIAGNGQLGVFIQQSSANVTLQGNYVGVAADGSGALGNGGDGVNIASSSHDNVVGGELSGAGNAIANNGGFGVSVAFSASKNAIQANSLYGNSGGGIALSGTYPLPNDISDGDSGGNLQQNFPVLGTVAFAAGTVTIHASLNSTPSTLFHVEAFDNPACHASGYGEGRTFVASTNATTDGFGNVSFTLSYGASAAPGVITLTAMDAGGNTSQLSACPTTATPDMSVVDLATPGFEPPPPADLSGDVADLSASARPDMGGGNMTSGCGCDVGGSGAGLGLSAFALALLVVLGRLRRRV